MTDNVFPADDPKPPLEPNGKGERVENPQLEEEEDFVKPADPLAEPDVGRHVEPKDATAGANADPGHKGNPAQEGGPAQGGGPAQEGGPAQKGSPTKEGDPADGQPKAEAEHPTGDPGVLPGSTEDDGRSPEGNTREPIRMFGDDANVRQEYRQEGEARPPQQLPALELQRVDDLVIEPPTVRDALRKNRCYVGDVLAPPQRIFLIHGPQGTGRFSCAVWLGLQILKRLGRRAVYQTHEQAIERISLTSVAESALELEDGSVYVVRNAFRKGLNRDSLATAHLAEIQAQLEKGNKYVVLTGTIEDGDDFSGVDKLVSISTRRTESPEYIAKVIRKYLDAYSSRAESVSTRELGQELVDVISAMEDGRLGGKRLRDLLRSPSQVERFFRLLAYHGVAPEQPASESHARQDGDRAPLDHAAGDAHLAQRMRELAVVVNPDDVNQVKQWFRGLSPNGKLYSLLVSIFEELDVDARWLHNLFTEVVNNLRRDKVNVHDPREDGLEQLFREIHVDETDNHLEFSAQLYAEEVQRQTASYRHLLWSAESVLSDWIVRNERQQFRTFRAVLGYALGRLGVHNWDDLCEKLREFAFFEQGHVAEIPAFALHAVVDAGGPHKNPVELVEIAALLKRWVREADHDRQHQVVWAVLAAAWHVYVALAHQIEDLEENVPPEKRGDRAATVETSDSSTSGEVASKPLKEALAATEQVLEDAVKHIVLLSFDLHLQEEPSASDLHWLHMLFHGLKRAFLEIFHQFPEDAVALLQRWMLGEPTLGDVDCDTKEDVAAKNHAAKTETADAEAGSTGTAAPDDRDQDAPDDEPDDDQDEVDEDDPERSGNGNVEAAAQARMRKEMLENFGAVIAAEVISRYEDPRLLMERTHGPLLKLVAPLLHLSAEDLEEGNSFRQQYSDAQASIDELMRILQGWLGNDQWRERVYGELLKALNRSHIGPRQRMCRNLSNHWLQHGNDIIRRIGQTLLGRALIIDGAPLDAPGGQQGLLAIDASDAARLTNSSPQVGFQLYERLRSLTDVAVGYMGRSTWIAEPDRAAAYAAFRLDRSSPRLAAPLLERLDATKTTYALMVAWGLPLDWEDIGGEAFDAWNGRVIGVVTDEQLLNWEGWPLGMQQFKQFESERNRAKICDHVTHVLRTTLSQRSSDQWRSCLEPHLPAETLDNADALRTHLGELSLKLDETPDVNQRFDVARLIGCGVQYLAGLDMRVAVELLGQWMEASENDPQPPLGLSYSLMLLQISLARPLPRGDATNGKTVKGKTGNGKAIGSNGKHGKSKKRLRLPTHDELNPAAEPPGQGQPSQEPVPPLPDVEAQGALLQLAPIFARKVYGYGVANMLEWVRRWIHDEQWARRFLGVDGRRELFEMVENADPTWRHRLIQRFRQWTKPRADLGETEPPAAAVTLAHALIEHLLIGDRKPFPSELAGDHSLFVVLLDPGFEFADSRRPLGEVALALHEHFYRRRKKRFKKVRMLTYRLGELSPAALPEDKPTAEGLLPRELPTRIPLAAPILENLPRESVSGVLLMSDRLPLDAEDFMQDWETQAKWWCYAEPNIQSPPWEIIEPRKKPKDSVKEIVDRFKPLLKGAVEDDDQ